jgi:hypothetical protein
MSKIYIHYGAKEFHKIQPIKNERCFTKPQGGLWASPVDAPFGWKEWCEREHFRENNEDNSFKFVVKDDSKIIHVRDVKDLEKLPKQKDTYDLDIMCCLDFEQIQKDFDGIELHLSEEEKSIETFCNGLYFKLYGWDCDSIIIFHDEAIEIVC